MPANRPVAPSLRADVEAIVRILREESEPYPDEDAAESGRRGGFAYCADELAQILAQHPEPQPSAAAGDEIVPWSEIQPGDLVLLDGRMVTAGRTGIYENAAAPGSIVTMMRIVYAKETGGVVIREVNPGHLTARRRPAPPIPELTAEELHARFACPGWEYRMTTGQRKAWADAGKPPDGDGWEPNTAVCPEAWERFDYHEEAYWRRPVPAAGTPAAAGTGEQ